MISSFPRYYLSLSNVFVIHYIGSPAKVGGVLAVSNLNRSLGLNSSLSLMSFWRPKGRKGPAHGKM